MDNGYKKVSKTNSNQSGRLPQVKSSKSEIQAKFYKIPVIKFEDQKLTSFSGLLLFKVLFRNLNLKERLRKCFTHLRVFPIFGRHLVSRVNQPQDIRVRERGCKG